MLSFDVYLEAVERLHSRGDQLLTGHHLLRARNRNLSHRNVAKDSICGCGGTSNFPEKSENRFVEIGAVAAKVLHPSKEKAYAKSKETSVELTVEEGTFHCGGCKVHPRQKDPFVGQLRKDASMSLKALVSRSKANGDDGDKDT